VFVGFILRRNWREKIVLFLNFAIFFCIFFFLIFFLDFPFVKRKRDNQTRMKGGWKERCLASDSFPCFFVFSSKEAFWKFSRSSLPLLIFFCFFSFESLLLISLLFYCSQLYFLLFLSLLIFDCFLISIFDLIFFSSCHWLGFCRINQSFF